MRRKISACIISYNEEQNIRRCLESVGWVDEIVLVDSFSNDKTVEIARQFTDRVFQNRWPGFVQQKNLALAEASHSWVLAVDADEVVSEQLRTNILRLLDTDGQLLEGYFIPRRTFHLGRWINHCGWYPNYQLRLFQKDAGRWEGMGLHEKVVLRQGKAGYLRGDLYHYPYHDLSDHLKRIDNYSRIFAEEMVKSGSPLHWWDLVFRPFFRFVKMYFLRLGFLDGKAGLVVSLLGGFYVFVKYTKFWELTHKVGAESPHRST